MSNHDPRTSTRTDGLYFPHFPADNAEVSGGVFAVRLTDWLCGFIKFRRI
jgi:hypothetical protein